METLDCIASRRSVRKYLDVPVEAEKLARVLNAGRLAPSAGNLQDWKFVVVSEPGKVRKIAECCLKQFWIETAPLVIVVCAELEKTKRFYGERGMEFYGVQDCAAATTQMLLAANDQGLGACWVGAFDDAKLRKCLEIPDEVKPLAVVTLGYADEKPEVPEKFSVEDVVFVEKWGGRIKDMAAYLGYYSTHVAKMAAKGKEFWQKFVQKLQK